MPRSGKGTRRRVDLAGYSTAISGDETDLESVLPTEGEDETKETAEMLMRNKPGSQSNLPPSGDCPSEPRDVEIPQRKGGLVHSGSAHPIEPVRTVNRPRGAASAVETETTVDQARQFNSSRTCVEIENQEGDRYHNYEHNAGNTRDTMSDGGRQSGTYASSEEEGPGRNRVQVETAAEAIEEFQSSIQHTIQEAVQQIAEAVGETVKNAIQSAMPEVQRQNTAATPVVASQSAHSSGAVTRDRRSRRRYTNRRELSTSSSSSSESTDARDQADQVSNRAISPNHDARRVRTNRTVKLPPFTGKEPWKVWYNRFSEVADRCRWNESRRLDELLPKLQGAAGEFAFGQLTKRVRGNYESLIQELKNRYRVVETAKTFGVQFSRRNQKPAESVEEYAAELKRLYDKAYVKRDKNTRREDLLRRFLDGLIDEKASFQVEYIRDPEDIDEAVFEVVSFTAAKQHQTAREQSSDFKRSKKATRMVRSEESDSEEKRSVKRVKKSAIQDLETDTESEWRLKGKRPRRDRKQRREQPGFPTRNRLSRSHRISREMEMGRSHQTKEDRQAIKGSGSLQLSSLLTVSKRSLSDLAS